MKDAKLDELFTFDVYYNWTYQSITAKAILFSSWRLLLDGLLLCSMNQNHYMKGAKSDDLLVTDVFWSCQDLPE